MFQRIGVLLTVLCLLQGCARAVSTRIADGQSPTSPPGSDEAVVVEEASGTVDLPRYPSISPDGTQVVFTWRGDLWKVAATGGHAIRLTNHPADDLRSCWSRDGRRIAFDSARAGWWNIFMMNADGTNIRQITDIDSYCVITGFGIDENGEEAVTLTSNLGGDVYRAPRPYICSTAGGDIVRLHGAFGGCARMSSDGSRVLFVRGSSEWSRRGYRGPDARDIWLYERDTGGFRQLTDWEGNDGRACWAGENAVVFVSDRDLNRYNLYLMELDHKPATVRQLTNFADRDVSYVDVSADGETVILTAWDKLYTVSLADPHAQPVMLEVTANEDESDNYVLQEVEEQVEEATLSPDGKVMAYVASGEVFVRNVEEKSPTRRVTDTSARERGVAWSPDGLKLYFYGDAEGSDSIYEATVALTRAEVKEEFEKATGKPKGTERELDQSDADTNGATPNISSNGAHSIGSNGVEMKSDNAGDEDVNEDVEGETKGTKSKAKGKLPKELQADRWHDALKFKVSPVVLSDANDRDPQPSPDGKKLAFRRGNGRLMVLDLDKEKVYPLVEGWDPYIDFRWSPDGRWMAYSQCDLDFNADIWVVPADGSAPAINITRHPDSDTMPRWSGDGRILAFASERVNEEFDIWSVYLDKNLEAMSHRDLEKYYKDAAKAAKKREPLAINDHETSKDAANETEAADAEKTGIANEDGKDVDEGEEDEAELVSLDLQDAYLRVRRITTLTGNEGELEITPAGDRYVFTAKIGDNGLYSVKWNGEDRKRLCGSATVQHVSLTGDKVVLVSKGRAGTVAPDGKKIEYVDIDAKMRVDLQAQASEKFKEMARVVGECFYDPKLKGLNWPELAEEYLKLAGQTRTADEFNYVGMHLLGELNASHLGVYSRGPTSANAQTKGRLGTVHHRVDQGYEVTAIIPESPAAKGTMALMVADVIVRIEQEPFGPTDTVESRLAGRVGKETMVTIVRSADGQERKELTVLLTPISASELDGLKYRAWRRENAELVSQWSGGRIGYIHVESMGQASLDVFERDLYAAASGKDGLIVDVRNNGGGWTADRLLASIMVQPHAYTIPRGADPGDVGHYPQDRLFIQRCTLPMNMLCNEKSFSNAEIVAHAFKTLRRGTLVGQQTYGGVISTGGTQLIDGTWVRLPFRGWYLLDGTDMENHGAMPDIIVTQTPQAESGNVDAQLRAAVEDLMSRL